MLKRTLIVTTLTLLVTLTAVASDREDDVSRTQKAAQVFQEIMNTPDQGIPSDLLESAKCIAIIPGDKKFAFVFGGSYGRDWQPVAPSMAGALRCLSLLMAGVWAIKSGALRPTW